MAIALEELYIDLLLRTEKYEAELDRLVTRARTTAQDIERRFNSVSIKIAPELDIQFLRNFGTFLTERQREYQRVSREINDKPIKPRVDTSEVDKLNNLNKRSQVNVDIKANVTDDGSVEREQRKLEDAGDAFLEFVNLFSQLKITPSVDHRPLQELNKHLTLKKTHLDEVRQYFSSHPIAPKVNLEELKSASEYLRAIATSSDAAIGGVTINQSSGGGDDISRPLLERMAALLDAIRQNTAVAAGTGRRDINAEVSILESVRDAATSASASTSADPAQQLLDQVRTKQRQWMEIQEQLNGTVSRGASSTAQLQRQATELENAIAKLRLQFTALNPVAKLPAGYLTAVSMMAGGKMPDAANVPQLHVNDRYLDNKNAQAAYDAVSNTIIITQALYDKLHDVARLGEQEVEVLLEEIQHAIDAGLGSLEGVRAAAQRQIRGDAPTLFDQNSITKATSDVNANYPADERASEFHAKAAAATMAPSVLQAMQEGTSVTGLNKATNAVGQLQGQINAIAQQIGQIPDINAAKTITALTQLAQNLAKIQSLKAPITALNAVLNQLSAFRLQIITPNFQPLEAQINDAITVFENTFATLQAEISRLGATLEQPIEIIPPEYNFDASGVQDIFIRINGEIEGVLQQINDAVVAGERQIASLPNLPAGKIDAVAVRFREYLARNLSAVLRSVNNLSTTVRASGAELNSLPGVDLQGLNSASTRLNTHFATLKQGLTDAINELVQTANEGINYATDLPDVEITAFDLQAVESLFSTLRTGIIEAQQTAENALNDAQNQLNDLPTDESAAVVSAIMADVSSRMKRTITQLQAAFAEGQRNLAALPEVNDAELIRSIRTVRTHFTAGFRKIIQAAERLNTAIATSSAELNNLPVLDVSGFRESNTRIRNYLRTFKRSLDREIGRIKATVDNSVALFNSFNPPTPTTYDDSALTNVFVTLYSSLESIADTIDGTIFENVQRLESVSIPTESINNNIDSLFDGVNQKLAAVITTIEASFQQGAEQLAALPEINDAPLLAAANAVQTNYQENYRKIIAAATQLQRTVAATGRELSALPVMDAEKLAAASGKLTTYFTGLRREITSSVVNIQRSVNAAMRSLDSLPATPATTFNPAELNSTFRSLRDSIANSFLAVESSLSENITSLEGLPDLSDAASSVNRILSAIAADAENLVSSISTIYQEGQQTLASLPDIPSEEIAVIARQVSAYYDAQFIKIIENANLLRNAIATSGQQLQAMPVIDFEVMAQSSAKVSRYFKSLQAEVKSTATNIQQSINNAAASINNLPRAQVSKINTAAITAHFTALREGLVQSLATIETALSDVASGIETIPTGATEIRSKISTVFDTIENLIGSITNNVDTALRDGQERLTTIDVRAVEESVNAINTKIRASIETVAAFTSQIASATNTAAVAVDSITTPQSAAATKAIGRFTGKILGFQTKINAAVENLNRATLTLDNQTAMSDTARIASVIRRYLNGIISAYQELPGLIEMPGMDEENINALKTQLQTYAQSISSTLAGIGSLEIINPPEVAETVANAASSLPLLVNEFNTVSETIDAAIVQAAANLRSPEATGQIAEFGNSLINQIKELGKKGKKVGNIDLNIERELAILLTEMEATTSNETTLKSFQSKTGKTIGKYIQWFNAIKKTVNKAVELVDAAATLENAAIPAPPNLDKARASVNAAITTLSQLLSLTDAESTRLNSILSSRAAEIQINIPQQSTIDYEGIDSFLSSLQTNINEAAAIGERLQQLSSTPLPQLRLEDRQAARGGQEEELAGQQEFFQRFTTELETGIKASFNATKNVMSRELNALLAVIPAEIKKNEAPTRTAMNNVMKAFVDEAKQSIPVYKQVGESMARAMIDTMRQSSAEIASANQEILTSVRALRAGIAEEMQALPAARSLGVQEFYAGVMQSLAGESAAGIEGLRSQISSILQLFADELRSVAQTVNVEFQQIPGTARSVAEQIRQSFTDAQAQVGAAEGTPDRFRSFEEEIERTRLKFVALTAAIEEMRSRLQTLPAEERMAAAQPLGTAVNQRNAIQRRLDEMQAASPVDQLEYLAERRKQMAGAMRQNPALNSDRNFRQELQQLITEFERIVTENASSLADANRRITQWRNYNARLLSSLEPPIEGGDGGLDAQFRRNPQEQQQYQDLRQQRLDAGKNERLALDDEFNALKRRIRGVAAAIEARKQAAIANPSLTPDQLDSALLNLDLKMREMEKVLRERSKRNIRDIRNAYQKEIDRINQEQLDLSNTVTTRIDQERQNKQSNPSSKYFNPDSAAAGLGQVFGISPAIEKLEQFEIKLRQTRPQVAKLMDSIIELGGAALMNFGLIGGAFAIVQLGRFALDTAIAFEKMRKSIELTAGREGLAAIGRLREQAYEKGVNFRESLSGYRLISASTQNTALQGNLTESIVTTTNEAIAARGLGKEEQNRSFLALGQIASKGKVSLEELNRQLGEALPGALQVAARGFQLTTPELIKMVSTGQVLSEEFLPKFVLQLKAESGLAGAGDTAFASMNRLTTAFEDLGESVGGGILGALKPILDGIATAIKFAVDNGQILALVLNGLVGTAVLANLGGLLTLLQQIISKMILSTTAANTLQAALSRLFAGLSVAAVATVFINLADLQNGSKEFRNFGASIQEAIDKLEEFERKKGKSSNNNLTSGQDGQITGNPVLSYIDRFIQWNNRENQKINKMFPQIGQIPFIGDLAKANIPTFGDVEIYDVNVRKFNQELKTADQILGQIKTNIDKLGKNNSLQPLRAEIQDITTQLNKARLEGDTNSVVSLTKKLNTKKQEEFNFLSDNLLDKRILLDWQKQLEEIITKIKSDMAADPSRAGLLSGELDKAKTALERVNGLMADFDRLTKESADGLGSLVAQFSKIEAAFAGAKQILENQKADVAITLSQRDRIGERNAADYRVAETRKSLADIEAEIFTTAKHLAEYSDAIGSISDKARAKLEGLLDKKLEEFNVGDIDRILNASGTGEGAGLATGGNKIELSDPEKTYLNSLKTLQERQLDLKRLRASANDARVAEAQAEIDAAKSQVAFAREMREARRNYQRTVEDAQRTAVRAARTLSLDTADINMQTSVASIRNDLMGRVKNSTSEFAKNIAGQTSDFIQSLFNASLIETKRFRIQDETQFSIEDITRQAQETANQLRSQTEQIQNRFNDYSGASAGEILAGGSEAIKSVSGSNYIADRKFLEGQPYISTNAAMPPEIQRSMETQVSAVTAKTKAQLAALQEEYRTNLVQIQQQLAKFQETVANRRLEMESEILKTGSAISRMAAAAFPAAMISSASESISSFITNGNDLLRQLKIKAKDAEDEVNVLETDVMQQGVSFIGTVMQNVPKELLDLAGQFFGAAGDRLEGAKKDAATLTKQLTDVQKLLNTTPLKMAKRLVDDSIRESTVNLDSFSRSLNSFFAQNADLSIWDQLDNKLRAVSDSFKDIQRNNENLIRGFTDDREIALAEAQKYEAAGQPEIAMRFKLRAEFDQQAIGDLKATAAEYLTPAMEQMLSDRVRREDERQRRLGAMQRETDLVTGEANAQSNRMDIDKYQAAQFKGQSEIATENNRFYRQVDELNEFARAAQLSDEELNKMYFQLRNINELNLKNITESMQVLKYEIQDVVSNSLADFFNSIFQGTKSAGEAFQDLGRTILNTISQIFAQIAAQQIALAVTKAFTGGFSSGGIVPGYAVGGQVEPRIGGYTPTSIQAALDREGNNAVLAALTPGEQVLSLNNGDAQFFRYIKQQGLWDSMKVGGGALNSVDNFATGGVVGRKDAYPYSISAGGSGGRQRSNITVNMNVQAKDADSFKRSESQLQRDLAYTHRRAMDRNG